jgi:guanyl-specific ribonuclease Sa
MGDGGETPDGDFPENRPTTGAAGNLIPQVVLKDLPLEAQHALLEIKGMQRPQSHRWRNRNGRLPRTGDQPPRYVEYDVPTPGSKGPGDKPNRGDRRIMRDTANDRWYYTGNAHENGGKSANFVEVVDMPKNLPYE